MQGLLSLCFYYSAIKYDMCKEKSRLIYFILPCEITVKFLMFVYIYIYIHMFVSEFSKTPQTWKEMSKNKLAMNT